MKSSRTRRHFAELGASVVRGDVPYAAITDELVAAGVRVEPFTVDVQGFEEYIERAGYARKADYYDRGRAPNAREKYLEHYVSLVLLAPQPGQVLIDVASMNSPFADVAATLFGVEGYRQDLMFDPGVHGRTIGGDAAAMPIADAFADHLSLHCSFEHFEGDADSRFIEEAARVLKPGGRLCSLPLYTNTHYAIQTHVRRWRVHDISFDAGDQVYVADHWGPPFGRYYDDRSFVRRVVEHLGDMRLVLYEVTNAAEVDPGCYLRYALLIEKPGSGRPG
jgi:SAM-dependent methyltransferase